MRILHTSDWHLGRSFHRVDLLGAQAEQLDHLVEVVRAEKVDVVLVAGDVYDRALPGVDAVALLDDGLARLRAAGATIVLSSGNHDSARRLGFGSRVMESGGVHVRTDPARAGRPVLLEDEHGPVAIYPLPYLEPALAADVLGCERSHEGVLSAAMDAVRADLAARRSDRACGPRSVVAAHAFVTGAQASDSERELAVGGLGQVGASTFAGADYVALGHLHGRQQLAPAVRYSGSPLAFSFSEADQVKGSWLVTLDGDGLAGVESVPAPVPRRLARLRGELHQLLHDPEYAGAEGAWCQVTLTDAVRPAMPMEQLRRRFGQVLELRLEPARADGAGVAAEGYAERIAGQGDLEVCCGFLAHVRQRPASGDEQRLMERALGDVVLAELEVATHETAAALDRNRTDGDLDGGLDGDGGFGAELHLVDAPRPRAGRRPRRTA